MGWVECGQPGGGWLGAGGGVVEERCVGWLRLIFRALCT